MRRLIAAAAWVLGLLAFTPLAQAQNVNGVALTTCGVPLNSPVAGGSYPVTTDLLSRLCVNVTTSPSGTQNVNLAGINGSAPSLTNPIYTAYAEAGDTTGTFTNATQTTSITATNADGYATALVSINGTYGTATGVFEASDDAGTTWYAVLCSRSDGTASETGYTTLTNTNRQWYCPVAGNDSFRIRSTAVASGTVNGRISISAPPTGSALSIGPSGAAANQVQGAAASGGTNTGNPVKTGCVFNSTPPTVTTSQTVDCQAAADGSVFIASAGLLTTGTNLNGGVIVPYSVGSTRTVSLPWGVSNYLFNGASRDNGCSSLGAVVASSTNNGTCTAAVEEAGRLYVNITTATTTLVKSGRGFVHTVCNNTPAASGVIQMWDSLTASGSKIGTITNPVSLLGMGPICATYDLAFTTGFTVVTTGTQDLTITFR